MKEKEFNIKHQQLVSGVSILAYWVSNYFVDFIKYLIPGVFCAGMVKAFKLKSFIDSNGYFAV